MERMVEKEYMCKFCNKKFPSGKSLGGHIRIHTNQFSISYNGKNPKNMKNNKKKRMVEQREITVLKRQQQLCCRECGKGFDSLKDLWSHMDCCHCEGEKLVMDSQSDTETTSSRKRSKKQSSSESFSNGRCSSSSASEIDQEHQNTALSLMMLSMDSKGLTFVVNSLVAELADNNSETKLSSEEQLKMIFNHDNGAILSDSYSSDSDYFMNGPKKSDSDSSIDTGSNIFRNGDELGVNERRTKYELRKSKRVVLPCYETDSCAVDTNIKIHRSSDIKSLMVVSAEKNSKGHECPICFKVFKSGQALGGHKRSHSIEHKIKHKEVADMRIDLNLPAQDIEE